MPTLRADTLIREWGERFRKDALASSVVSGLRGRSDEIWQGTFQLLQRESSEYRNSVDDEFTKESKSHCNELLKMIVAVAARRVARPGADPFDFVRTHAEWRARRQVPLIASLHEYRLAHRTYWGLTREALLRHAKKHEAIVSLAMLSDFWIEFFDHIGAVLAEAHAVEEGLIVAQSTRTYIGLINNLLRGVEPSDPEARRLCALCGIRPGVPMAVAVARPFGAGNGRGVDLDVALRSFVRLVDQVLPSAAFGKLVDIRNGEVMAIVCSETKPAHGLVEALRRNGLARSAVKNGLATGVGISQEKSEIALLPEAVEEARLALEFADAAQPVAHFPGIDLLDFLIRRADDAALRLVPEWARDLSQSDDDQLRELASTVRAFAGCNLNVKQTARRLRVHANTVYFRLNRIEKLTGVDPRSYSGTAFLVTALRLLEVHGKASRRASVTQ